MFTYYWDSVILLSIHRSALWSVCYSVLFDGSRNSTDWWLSIFVFRQVVTFSPKDQKIAHSNKHEEPRHMQHYNLSNQIIKRIPVTEIVKGINVSIFQHDFTFRQDTFVNHKWQNSQSKNEPQHTHATKANCRCPFPFQKVGKLTQINWHIGYIVNQKHHGTNSGTTKMGTSNNEQIGHNMVNYHFSKVTSNSLAPTNGNWKALDGVVKFHGQTQFQQTNDCFEIVGTLHKIIPCHSRIHGMKG